jgi:hypothetical protein
VTRTKAPVMPGYLTRDRLAVLASVAVPLVLAAVLVPFRASFPNTDAALAMLLVVVAVAAGGRVRRSGRRRAGQQPSRRSALTGASVACQGRPAGNDIGAFLAEEGMLEVA